MPRRKISNALVAASLALFALPISAYALVGEPGSTASQTPPSVIVFNQKPKGDQINVTYAYLPTAGQLVIYGGEKGGKAGGDALGSVTLDAGDHRDIAVKLDKPITGGTSIWASLTNADGKSFWHGGAMPAENEFVIE